MKKAASVFLRGNLCKQDLMHLSRWLQNPQITCYLNEQVSAVYDLYRLADTVPEPMLGFHLNRYGHFFMICGAGAEAHTIGFVKLAHTASAGEYEIVYAIGEDTLWGQGYGEAAIDKALRIAFSKLGAHSVIAKINPANERSRRLAAACGFRNVGASGSMQLYRVGSRRELCTAGSM